MKTSVPTIADLTKEDADRLYKLHHLFVFPIVKWVNEDEDNKEYLIDWPFDEDVKKAQENFEKNEESIKDLTGEALDGDLTPDKG